MLELARSEYLDRRENVLALGNSGTGKTHLALALGLAACQQGYRVRFTTAAALVNDLLEARDDKRLLRLQKQLAKQDLLIVDEQRGEEPGGRPTQRGSGGLDGAGCESRGWLGSSSPAWEPEGHRMTAASKTAPCKVAAQGNTSRAERISRDVRPMFLEKQWAQASKKRGGVWVQAPTHGLQR